MRLVSVITPCYNEADNVAMASERVKQVFLSIPDLDYEHIFADNSSTDETEEILRSLASRDARVKIILNSSNYGPTRSVFNALLAAKGDAVIILACDLQDPPELIPEFLKIWNEGYDVVFGIRRQRNESPWMTYARRMYYRLVAWSSNDKLLQDAGDFVLIDRKVQETLSRIKDCNPYLRGLLVSLGFRVSGVSYCMGPRTGGQSKASSYSLFLYALNGFVNHTLMPLRIATVGGITLSFFSIVLAVTLTILRLLNYTDAPAGITTIVVSFFFMSGIQLFLLGFLGEFIGNIYRQQKNLPLVIEKERINF